MKRRFGVTISAMILAAHMGSPLAAAEPTIEQLNEIAAYLEGNDVQGLRVYVSARPELLEGDTQMAILLRKFMTESVNVAEYLNFEPDLRDTVLNVAVPQVSQEAAEEDEPEAAPPVPSPAQPATPTPVQAPTPAPPAVEEPESPGDEIY